MSDNFRRAYSELIDFIANHPEIEIGESVTSIPESVRSDFYAKFNSTRHAFVEEKFPECLSRAGILREEYGKAIEEAAGLLSLEDTHVVSRLRRFLCDSKESLTRDLFDPLFDLLKKRETLESFEKRTSSGINEIFPVVYRGGYEKWAILNLANLLEIEKALRVPVRELLPGDRAKSAAYAPMEEVPSPIESTSFYFSQPPKAIFSVPDFIIHSAKLNRFVGIRSEFKEGIYNALDASREREWYPLDVDLLILLEGGLTLIYVAEEPKSISLIADVAKFCRPDLILWCVDTQATSQTEALEKMALADGRLKPTRGSFIVANGSWPETGDSGEPPVLNGQMDGEPSRIRILTVGFDRLKLMPVIEALGDAESSAITT